MTRALLQCSDCILPIHRYDAVGKSSCVIVFIPVPNIWRFWTFYPRIWGGHLKAVLKNLTSSIGVLSKRIQAVTLIQFNYFQKLLMFMFPVVGQWFDGSLPNRKSKFSHDRRLTKLNKYPECHFSQTVAWSVSISRIPITTPPSFRLLLLVLHGSIHTLPADEQPTGPPGSGRSHGSRVDQQFLFVLYSNFSQ